MQYNMRLSQYLLNTMLERIYLILERVHISRPYHG